MVESGIDRKPYMGISLHLHRIDLSQAFHDRFVGKNRFAGLYWNAEKEELEITFYPSDNEVAYRIPIMKPSDNPAIIRICCARFIKNFLRQYKRQRYAATDIDVTSEGITTVKFKMERTL